MHPSTQNLLKFFQYQHLPGHLQAVSRPCADLAFDMADKLPSGPELTTGLRKLLEAKDCFVRANVRQGDHAGTPVKKFALVQDTSNRHYAIPGDKTELWSQLSPGDPIPHWAQPLD